MRGAEIAEDGFRGLVFQNATGFPQNLRKLDRGTGEFADLANKTRDRYDIRIWNGDAPAR